ncbi:MAG: hypothetical protein ACSLEM_06425 [Candidatus Malihini olakiniferum]
MTTIVEQNFSLLLPFIVPEEDGCGHCHCTIIQKMPNVFSPSRPS